MPATFDFDRARHERRARRTPPTIVVDGDSHRLPAGMPASLQLDLLAREQGSLLRVDEAVDFLGRIYPPQTVDGWVADGWTDTDLFELLNTTLALIRGVPVDDVGTPQPDEDSGGDDPGEGPGPDSGPDSSSKAGSPSKPTSNGSTGPT